LLTKCKGFLPKNSLIYLDPPYYVKGAGLYRNFYKHEDHLKIANFLKDLDFDIPWVVSYDNASEIRDMYAYARSFTYGLRYTAQSRYVGSEVMFFKDGLKLPADFESTLAA
jgi:DNA adenine methylase